MPETPPPNLADIRAALLAQMFAARPQPVVLDPPAAVRGFRLRVQLLGTGVWRSIDVPGDIELPTLHDVVQEAMGWTNSHLHRFRTSDEHPAPEFLTPFDVEEGDEGTLETGIRLDQVVTKPGDRLWYDYDFGDGWEHELRVEHTTDTPPDAPVCIAGEGACPPEDCGGVPGYTELAEWVRNDYARDFLPGHVDDEHWLRQWLPRDWHPDRFDLERANDGISAAISEPIAVKQPLADLVEAAMARGAGYARHLLALPQTRGTTEVSAEDAARMTAHVRTLIETVGDGVTLTNAGYLPPAIVKSIAPTMQINEGWVLNASSEANSLPVRRLRDVAQALGLVSVRTGRMTVPRAVRAIADDPSAILAHTASRLPVGGRHAAGKPQPERDIGWAALVAVAAEVDDADLDGVIALLAHEFGWEAANGGLPSPITSTWHTLAVLSTHGTGWSPDVVQHPALSAFARSVIRAQ